LLLLSGSLCAQPILVSPQKEAFAGSGLTNLRLRNQSPDGAEAILTVDFVYDGLHGPTARLLPLITDKKQPKISGWFGANPVTVSSGHGTISFRIKFFNDEPGVPKELSTDHVRVLMFAGGGNSVISQGIFSMAIKWGSPNAAPQPGTQPAEQAHLESEAQARARQEALLKSEADEKARQQAETQRLADEKAKAEADAKAREEARLQAEAAEKARQQAEAQRLADEKAKAEADAQAREVARLKAEAEVKARQEAVAKQLSEEKAKSEVEAKAEAEAKAREQARLKAEADEKERQEAVAKQLAEEKARAAAEAQAREKDRLKADAEEKARQEAEAKRLAEERAKAEAEAKRLADEKTAAVAAAAAAPAAQTARPAFVISSRSKTKVTNVDVVNRSIDRTEMLIAVEYQYAKEDGAVRMGVDLESTEAPGASGYFSCPGAEVGKGSRNFVMVPVKLNVATAQNINRATLPTDKVWVYLADASGRKSYIFQGTMMLVWNIAGGAARAAQPSAESAAANMLDIESFKQNDLFSGYVAVQYNLRSGQGRLRLRIFDSANPSTAAWFASDDVAIKSGPGMELVRIAVPRNAPSPDVFSADTVEVQILNSKGTVVTSARKQSPMSWAKPK
jgi:hypothetical protein